MEGKDSVSPEQVRPLKALWGRFMDRYRPQRRQTTSYIDSERERTEQLRKMFAESAARDRNEANEILSQNYSGIKKLLVDNGYGSEQDIDDRLEEQMRTVCRYGPPQGASVDSFLSYAIDTSKKRREAPGEPNPMIGLEDAYGKMDVDKYTKLRQAWRAGQAEDVIKLLTRDYNLLKEGMIIILEGLLRGWKTDFPASHQLIRESVNYFTLSKLLDEARSKGESVEEQKNSID